MRQTPMRIMTPTTVAAPLKTPTQTALPKTKKSNELKIAKAEPTQPRIQTMLINAGRLVVLLSGIN
jgi:hypothetical protein